MGLRTILKVEQRETNVRTENSERERAIRGQKSYGGLTQKQLEREGREEEAISNKDEEASEAKKQR